MNIHIRIRVWVYDGCQTAWPGVPPLEGCGDHEKVGGAIAGVFDVISSGVSGACRQGCAGFFGLLLGGFIKADPNFINGKVPAIGLRGSFFGA